MVDARPAGCLQFRKEVHHCAFIFIARESDFFSPLRQRQSNCLGDVEAFLKRIANNVLDGFQPLPRLFNTADARLSRAVPWNNQSRWNAAEIGERNPPAFDIGMWCCRRAV